ncbi:MAG: molecular chaperone, partial [Cyanobacteria bacterium J06639_18]
MPIKVELLNRYQLRAKEDNPNLLVLPVIEIIPTEGFYFPFISQINISVSGFPSDLAALIQFAYGSANFSSVQPLQLSSPKRLKQTECRWGHVLPSGVDCTLEVSIKYFNSDRTGYPIMSAPKHCTAECNIWTNGESVTPTSIKQPLLQPAQSLPEENNKLEITYPGWFAIDFGTSNSTVTLYDPKTIVT